MNQFIQSVNKGWGSQVPFPTTSWAEEFWGPKLSPIIFFGCIFLPVWMHYPKSKYVRYYGYTLLLIWYVGLFHE